MIKFNAKLRKILKSENVFHNTHAHLYKDGIIIFEKKNVKVSGIQIEITVNHCVKFKEPIKIRHNKSYSQKSTAYNVKKLLISNSTLLLDGIKDIEVFYDNSSEKMKSKGIKCNTVILTTTSGMRIYKNEYDFVIGEIKIQNSIPNDWGYLCKSDTVEDAIKFIKAENKLCKEYEI